MIPRSGISLPLRIFIRFMLSMKKIMEIRDSDPGHARENRGSYDSRMEIRRYDPRKYVDDGDTPHAKGMFQ